MAARSHAPRRGPADGRLARLSQRLPTRLCQEDTEAGRQNSPVLSYIHLPASHLWHLILLFCPALHLALFLWVRNNCLYIMTFSFWSFIARDPNNNNSNSTHTINYPLWIQISSRKTVIVNTMLDIYFFTFYIFHLSNHVLHCTHCSQDFPSDKKLNSNYVYYLHLSTRYCISNMGIN